MQYFLVLWRQSRGIQSGYVASKSFDTHLGEMSTNGITHHVLWAPRLDVRELDHAFVVEVDLPGMSPKDITVSLENNRVIIAGERKAVWSKEASRPTHRALSYGAYKRALTLPTTLNVDQAEAMYTNGVLTVTIPKAAEARTKRIAIQAA